MNEQSQKTPPLHTVDTGMLSRLSFEIGPIRPPSEGGSHSLLLRLTRNCPWSRCRFCYAIMYGRQKFELRGVEEIKKDIDTVKAIAGVISSASKELGYRGKINDYVGTALIRSEPDLNYNQCFVYVFRWLYMGGKTVFLQDANTMIMPTHDLGDVLKYLKQSFPAIDRITSYSRAKTLSKKSLEELKELHDTGLTRLHVGLETGDDELLKYVDKGVTSAEQIDAGKKAKETGFELSEYVMPDLGGRERSKQHALNTARVLNEINPDFIRMRPFVVGIESPMYDDYSKGIYHLSSPHERLREIKLFVENLNVTGRLCFDHMLNAWYTDESRHYPLFKQDHEGYKLPEDKGKVLALIDKGLAIDESVHISALDLVNMAS